MKKKLKKPGFEVSNIRNSKESTSENFIPKETQVVNDRKSPNLTKLSSARLTLLWDRYVKHGDRSVFNVIVEWCYLMFLREAKRIAYDSGFPNKAEDWAHDGILLLSKQRYYKGKKPIRDFPSYAYKIIRNYCFAQVRKERKYREKKISKLPELAVEPVDNLDQKPDFTQIGEDLLWQVFPTQKSAEQRKAARMMVRGFSSSMIAKELDWGLAKARDKCYRARKKLRNHPATQAYLDR